VKKVKDDVRKIRRGFLSEYLSKINRTRDPFISYTDTRTFSVFDRHHIDLEHEAILKASAYPYPENESSKVSGYSKISIDSKDILIWKSPGYGPLMLKGFWSASRVWKNALMLRWLSIRTPHPIAIVMRKRGAFRWDCFVFFKSVEGIRFGDMFFSKTVSGEDKELVAACLADTLSVMNGMGIYMGRISHREILTSESCPIFLGLDAIGSCKFGVQRKQAKSLRLFLLQWEDLPIIKDTLMKQFENFLR
jgi:hypothetical protein